MSAFWPRCGLVAVMVAVGTAAWAASPSAPVLARGVGIVRAMDAKAGSITLDHEPILALKWPARTDTLKLASPALLKGISLGQSVRIRLNAAGVVTAISPD